MEKEKVSDTLLILQMDMEWALKDGGSNSFNLLHQKKTIYAKPKYITEIGNLRDIRYETALAASQNMS